MVWAIILLAVVFIIGIMMKGAEVSYKDIEKRRAAQLKAQADRKYLEQMDPRKFEYVIADLFRSRGYEAQVTPGSNDGGKDIILRKGGEVKFVEVKRYAKSTIGRPLIQKLHSAIVDAEAVGGYFVTLSQFNKNARQYAANKNIELIDGDELLTMMNAR